MPQLKDSLHNKKLGARGERKAAQHLKAKGYRIVERNFRTPFCEVDIIARKGEVLAFVEVKTRLNDSFGLPCEAVTPAKQRLYIRAAEYYFAARQIEDIVRFDVIEVFPDRINHIENAFCKA